MPKGKAWGTSWADIVLCPVTVFFLVKNGLEIRKKKKKRKATINADLDHGAAAQRWDEWHEEKARKEEENAGKTEAQIEAEAEEQQRRRKEEEEKEATKLTLLEEMTGKNAYSQPVQIVDTEDGKRKVYGEPTIYQKLPPKEERFKESGANETAHGEDKKPSMLDV